MTVSVKQAMTLSVLLLLTTVAPGLATEDSAYVGHLEMGRVGDALEVLIESTEGVSYTYFGLEGPRLVMDFHGAENRLGFAVQPVAHPGVRQVRASAFSDETRDVTRVVFDLEPGVSYSVQRAAAGQVRVRFEGAAAPLAAAPPRALVPAPRVELGGLLAAMHEQARGGLPRTWTASRTFDPLAIDPLGPKAEARAELATADPAAVFSIPVAAPAAAVLPAFPATPSPALGLAAAPPSPVLAAPAPAPPAFLGQAVTAPHDYYTGEIISLDLKNVDVRDFFRLISDISGLNVVLDPNVSGAVTLVLTDVPWDQALDVVLRNNSLGYELQGNVLRIATRGTLQAEEDARIALRQAQELNAPLDTRSFILSYTQADAASSVINSVLSQRGSIITDARRNALIVTDIQPRFERINALVQFLDQPAQQVEIEARLLSANKSFSRDLGNQLGIVIGNNSSNVLGGLPSNPSPFTRNPAPGLNVGGQMPLIADFGAAAGTAGLSFLLGVGGDVLLDEIISVAESRGTARLLSRPKVTTQNNQPATVSQGTQIPVQTNVNNTVAVTYLPFALTLNVTPQITDAGTILLIADIENSAPNFEREVNGIPAVATQKATTQVLIPDGGTAVIGGILVDSDSVTVNQIPGLGNIPILGNLFKRTQTAKSTNELLFFITARIKPANPLEFLALDEPNE